MRRAKAAQAALKKIAAKTAKTMTANSRDDQLPFAFQAKGQAKVQAMDQEQGQEKGAASAPQPAGLAARALREKGILPEIKDYLSRLNEMQRAAVCYLDGPLLVLAGAGTGKTSVLTAKVSHIVASGRAQPHQILAVTFTNKAAREMKLRISRHLGENIDAALPWVGTFHSICVKLLRRHAELVGLKSNFTILDTDDQLHLLKQIIKAEGIDEKRWNARALAAIIDRWKNRGLTADAIPAGEMGTFANGQTVALYKLYQERLTTLNAADFGDLLMHAIELLRKDHSILAEYQRRFRYMLVDEYQDTNVAQYLWLRLLASGNRNICCVGDDDQSIYGWRGAEVGNILRFETDFPGAKIIRLESNYRSSAPILAAASHLISHNNDRLGKTLHPAKNSDEEDGDDIPKVKMSSAWDSEEEARIIGDDIEAFERKGISLDECAVLVRASFQMREFEDRFVTLGLNYRVIGGPRFYERKEIRDAVAYFRCVVHDTDDLAFERIVNTPRRGLGQKTVQLLQIYARGHAISLMQAARQIIETDELTSRARTALAGLVSQFDRWRAQACEMSHIDLAEIILDESGYTQMWQDEKTADAPARLENLKELLRSLQEFDSLPGFLEHISLAMDRASDGQQNAVSIMTLHSAKGLEFDAVFLPGWEEGLFPHQRALDESGGAGLEEERRLAYVGMTRARRHLKICFAANRRIHGLWQSSIPSRFIDELPEDSVEITSDNPARSTGYDRHNAFYQDDIFSASHNSPGWRRAAARAAAQDDSRQSSAGPGRARHFLEGELIARSQLSKTLDFQSGERVFHLKFGYGKIMQMDGNKLHIAFEKAGQKKVLAEFIEKC